MRTRRVVATALILSQITTSCAHKAPEKDIAQNAKSTERAPSDLREKIAERFARKTAKPSTLKDTPWTTWSEMGEVGALLVLGNIREKLLEENLVDPQNPNVNYRGYKAVNCSTAANRNFRTANGTCNDLNNDYAGAAGVAFGRNVKPEFIDKDAQAKLQKPPPELVSKTFFTREEFKPVPDNFLNMLAAVWIQFMNHDWLTHGRNEARNPIVVDAADGSKKLVERTKVNRADPANYLEGFDKVSLNEVTHWWDASQIYGSSLSEQKALRSFEDGKMKTVTKNGREILPQGFVNPAHNKQNRGYEATGFRDNWWVGLSMLHTLFVKEHNAIAAELKSKHASFDAKAKKWKWTNEGQTILLDKEGLDEQIFQTARLINAAILAKIHTVEWTPAILPNPYLKIGMFANWYGIINPLTWPALIQKRIPLLNRFPIVNSTDWFKGTRTGYVIGGIVGDKTDNFGVPFSITEEFTSVYRLHSLLPESLLFRSLGNPAKVEDVAFKDTRNEKSYDIMKTHDLKDLYYSFGTQKPGGLVLNNFPRFMQELEIPGFGKMDLGMVDIIRDRERGVPRYNKFREGLGLKKIKSYSDFFPAGKDLSPEQLAVIDKFRAVYGVNEETGEDNVDDIDLLVGTLAEEVRPAGFGFGETMFQIFILMASRRLMADRFFTEYYRPAYYTRTGLDWIDQKGTLAQVITRHMPELTDKVAGLDTAFLPWKE